MIPCDADKRFVCKSSDPIELIMYQQPGIDNYDHGTKIGKVKGSDREAESENKLKESIPHSPSPAHSPFSLNSHSFPP